MCIKYYTYFSTVFSRVLLGFKIEESSIGCFHHGHTKIEIRNETTGITLLHKTLSTASKVFRMKFGTIALSIQLRTQQNL